MATPPLPASPVVRVRLDYRDTTNLKSGSRLYLGYSGSAPSAADCVTLAGDIASAWLTDLAPLITTNYALAEVDVLDITTEAGASGTWSGSNTGTRSGTSLPNQCATNVEFDIARRYRGGKPRMYLPPGAESDLNDASTYTGTFVTAVNSGVSAFVAALEALSIGSMGSLSHVNVSFYQGYRTRTTGGGQTTFAPKYRTGTAVVDPITGYAAKVTIGSQRRRRTSTTY